MTTGPVLTPREDRPAHAPRLLFLCQVLPYPLDAGPKVRAYHVLRWLAERADVDLACFTRADDPPAAVDHLRTFCASVHTVPLHRSRLRDAAHLARSIAAGTSFIIERDDVGAMHRLLADLARRERYDAVHADQLWMARYAGALPIPLKVLDNHNAVYRVFERLAAHEPSRARRWLWRREARCIARYEVEQLARFDHVLFVTEEDRAAIAAAGAAPGATSGATSAAARLAAHTSVVPICVDTAAIAPVDIRPDARRLTILGTMFWPPNAEGAHWFADNVFPRVLEQAPQARLTIVGKHPPRSIARLAETFGASVEVAGYVADVRPYLEETAALIVPLLSGGGMRVKILDAWAWGLPVVSTTVGIEGIDARAGQEAFIADSPLAFADACADLLASAALRQRTGRAGRAAVEARYDARRVYDALGAAYGWAAGGA